MAMNQARVGLLVAAALVAMPATAFAQPKPAKAAAGKNQPKKDDPPPPPAPPPPPDQPVDVPAAGGEEGGGLGDICKIDPTACPSVDLDKAAARDMNPEMYAVQQIYALRYHRVEINPYFALTMNDQFVSHNGPGLGINFYILNTLAIGVNGNFYQGLNSVSAFNLETSRAARVGEPINQYQWSAAANVTYVPAYGKFAGFGNFIFHYDFFVHAGGGVISTAPIANIDPDNRTFTFKPKPMGQLGGGLRIFFNRWLAIVFEVSDYIYGEQLESTTIASGVSTNCSNGMQGLPASQCPDTWLAPGVSITNNVQAQVGLSFFLPFTWEYRLPK
jgi:outer membrane beta-barrel protein